MATLTLPDHPRALRHMVSHAPSVGTRTNPPHLGGPDVRAATVLDRIERAALADLRIHLCNRVIVFHNPKPRIEVGNGIFQSAIQLEQLAKDLLSAAATIILRGSLEIAMQKIDHRQIG